MSNQSVAISGLDDAADTIVTIKPSDIDRLDDTAVAMTRHISVLRFFHETGLATGDYVRFAPELGFMPILIGRDGNPVFLFHFVEVIDEILDYEILVQEFPTLSYSQVAGAIAFLRKISQFNVRNVNIDAVQDDEDLKDPEFDKRLEQALLNQGDVARVLTDNS
ncbi:MAG: hypothetical protein IPM63_07815 [Acidobacteriota bacterium]|nr:MAG: hypothetical protein IPM63_07815 [Acidobacteriota bacterium]